MDDIDENFQDRRGSFSSEGKAHAVLAKCLAAATERPVFVVPRAYSNDIAADSPEYPADFAGAIDPSHPVFLCGTDIVAQTVRRTDFRLYTNHMQNRIVVWDNLYATDYCPRRLFVGPWTGRDDASDVLLNPTGFIETDLVLLALMAASGNGVDKTEAWKSVLREFEVPDEFLSLAPFFNHPPFLNDAGITEITVTEDMYSALELLLWKWKTPLSREWYPYLMGLKQDLLLYEGKLPAIRILKTQSLPMALRLSGASPGAG